MATDAAFQALGIEMLPIVQVSVDLAPIQTDDAATLAEPEASTQLRAPNTRAGTKQAKLVAMLQEPEGASLDEIVAATG